MSRVTSVGESYTVTVRVRGFTTTTMRVPARLPFDHLLLDLGIGITGRNDFDGDIRRARSEFLRDAARWYALSSHKGNIWGSHGIGVSGDLETCIGAEDDA